MQHTLVAVFDDRSDAQNALNELVSSGFPREEISLSNADPTGMTDSTGRSLDPVHGAPIKHIFTDLFGADNSIRASRYEGAVTRGHHVLIVRAGSLPEVERAADIVERFGPTDVDEQASQAGAVGMDTGGPPESMRTGGAGSMQQASPESAQPRAGSRLGTSRHLDNPGDRMVFQQHSLNRSEPAGGTYQEPLGESGLGATGSTSLHGSTLRENAVHAPSFEDLEVGPGGGSGSMQRDTSLGGAPQEGPRVTESQRGRSRIYSGQASVPTDGVGGLDIGSEFLGEDDDYYRKHFLSNYGGEDYERVKPAYDYGADMALHDKYHGREWHEVESELRSDWEDRNASMAGLSWEKMKTAVRRGWDRMTLHRDADSYYRSHYDTHLVSSGMDYDSVKPAYSYGAEMRKSELYRNRPWDDVEGHLARGWHSRKGAGSGRPMQGAWDRMKAAVRHGWDRITADDDDREYRSHWDATYGSAKHAGSYDEYKPAYTFGSAMARDDRYRGRQWNEVENELRTDWDTRHGSGGQSSWEQVKSAVRHGWDRMSS